VKNIVINTLNNYPRSLLVTEDELWLSDSKIKDINSFKNGIAGISSDEVTVYKLIYFQKLKHNSKSEIVRIIYKVGNIVKKIKLEFNNQDEANVFFEFFGKKLGFRKSIEKEKKIKPLIINIFLLFSIVFFTYMICDPNNITSLTTSGKKGGIITLLFIFLHATVGKYGIILIGTLIFVYSTYKLYRRFKNPANNMIFKKG